MNKIIPLAIVCCAAPLLIFGIIAWNGSGDGNFEETGNVGTNIGDQAPSFSITDSVGKKIELSDYRGKKVIVITSTATWCPTCIVEAKQFSPVWQEFKNKAVQFLSVSIDPTDNDAKMEQFKQNYGAPWPHTHPGRPGVKDMILDYKITRFEITYIIDTEGVIRFKDTGITSTEVLQDELEKVLTNIEPEELGILYEDQGKEHVAIEESHPLYNSNPPTSGWHYQNPADWGIYQKELPDEQLIHDLEHGGIWISYRPDIPSDQKMIIEYIAAQYSAKVIVTPRPENDSDVAVAAWQRLLKLEVPLTEEKRGLITQFIDQYKNKGPEFIPDYMGLP